MIMIFCGPTLPGMGYLPPAECGSVYRAVQQRPTAIGIVDGYFDHRLAVWHKEILYALESGIPVYGAASMGALRAAELGAFGMIGVGKIFEKYESGEWMDDDEVAVAHASEEFGYRAASESMANIRFTLGKAVAVGVLSQADHDCYIALGKAMFYPERSYEALLESRPNAALAAWLPVNRVDQKRQDALLMIEAIRTAEPHQANFVLEPSIFWNELRKEMDGRRWSQADETVIAKLGEDAEVRAAALGWWLSRKEALTGADLMEASERFAGVDVEAWLQRNHCSQAELETLVANAAQAARSETAAGPALNSMVLRYLRWTGEYQRLL